MTSYTARGFQGSPIVPTVTKQIISMIKCVTTSVILEMLRYKMKSINFEDPYQTWRKRLHAKIKTKWREVI